MLAGGDVTVTLTKDSVMINDAQVKTANVKASNGVVHIIDKVLIPKDFSAPDIPALATSANLTTLVEALKAADLVSAVQGGPLTVFAPTNEAFDKLPAGVLAELLLPANIASLQQVLKYHVHSGEVQSKDLTNGENVTTLEGKDLKIAIGSGSVQVLGGQSNANVTLADQFAFNGVVHVIDAVLLPPDWVLPSTIPGIAGGNKDLSTLVTALEAADLVKTLEGTGPFTVFAPSNAAFSALGFDGAKLTYLLNNKKQLTEVLEYHVTAGSVLSTDLTNGEHHNLHGCL